MVNGYRSSRDLEYRVKKNVPILYKIGDVTRVAKYTGNDNYVMYRDEVLTVNKFCRLVVEELIQDELNSGHFITAGNWPTQKDAESFQSVFSKQQDELMKYCKKSCRREMYQVKNTWSWKAQKAA